MEAVQRLAGRTVSAAATALAIVPARGGSKGVPGKNLRLIGGKPLIAWTILAALESAVVGRVVVSTDDSDIADVALEWGAEVPFLRPDALATDEATTMQVVHHALQVLAPPMGLMVVLQPTSPLRSASDIDAGVALCLDSGATSCVAVAEATKSPWWMYSLDPLGRLAPLLDPEGGGSRRQDLPAVYVVNGALYVGGTQWAATTDSFISTETVGYVMPPERSLDIDTELDLVLAEALIARGTHENLS
jgi:CMP-N,N'-diacetyllegionaminic acid synthase